MTIKEAPSQEPILNYRGIEIKGVDHLSSIGILTSQDVTDLLGKLPEGYFNHIPLGAIVFEPYKFYSARRDDEVIYTKEVDLLSTDEIIARKRGVTRWNRVIEDGVAVATDGKVTIHIFSPENWDDQQDIEQDRNTALYTLAHEIGHTIWQTIVYGKGMLGSLTERGISLPSQRLDTHVDYMAFIDDWMTLVESNLPRYSDYKDVFLQENQSDGTGTIHYTDDELSRQEDFAIAHEYLLHWNNLAQLDATRNNILARLHEKL